MAFGDRTEVIGVGGGVHLSESPAETLVGRFRFGTHIRQRLVWVNRKAALFRQEESVL
jgi:hypothetical protein